CFGGPEPMLSQQLILKRASASRPSGKWNEDDYDVLAGDVVVGRIMKAIAAPVGSPWFWTLAFGYHRDRRPTQCSDTRARHGRIREELAAGIIMRARRQRNLSRYQKIFFAKASFTQRLPLYGTEPFLDRFLGEGV